MTEQEARNAAEETVYVDYVLGDIIADCQRRGIPTHTKKGKLKNRSELEQKLIDAMVKEWTKQE